MPIDRPELVPRLIFARDPGKERPEDIVDPFGATFRATVEREQREGDPVATEPVVKGAADGEKGHVGALRFFTVKEKRKEVITLIIVTVRFVTLRLVLAEIKVDQAQDVEAG